ncbi:hypothetical protein ACODNH_21750 [Haloarcula sp. NS06]|uniref:hypothetical protein n=1 Tax=unclassified Haloarcula TaxID=2624677 RepID=UPI0027B6FBA0|nr:hypothetical protein [Haloarcula sp. H-GB4]MDQ2074106.1 hypothetical protein [Haloarcula sp. H-GB4]
MTELTQAIDIADRMLAEGRSAVVELNNNSLRWRGTLDQPIPYSSPAVAALFAPTTGSYGWESK